MVVLFGMDKTIKIYIHKKTLRIGLDRRGFGVDGAHLKGEAYLSSTAQDLQCMIVTQWHDIARSSPRSRFFSHSLHLSTGRMVFRKG